MSGYDKDFTGVEIAYPGFSNTLKKRLYKNKNNKDPQHPYRFDDVFHSFTFDQVFGFSVVIAYWIDTEKLHTGIDSDDWAPHPAIPANLQHGGWLYYRNVWDQGHGFPKFHAAQGLNHKEAQNNARKTYRRHNCFPQHEDFNQGRKSIWYDLEHHTLVLGQKLLVLVGPILTSEKGVVKYERDGHSAYIPPAFFKVIAGDMDGAFTSLSFLMPQNKSWSQRQKIPFSDTMLHQVPLSVIAELTGIEFPEVLIECDPLNLAHINRMPDSWPVLADLNQDIITFK